MKWNLPRSGLLEPHRRMECPVEQHVHAYCYKLAADAEVEYCVYLGNRG
jgi:hypothetical protein